MFGGVLSGRLGDADHLAHIGPGCDVVLHAGNHHDFALVEVGHAAPPPHAGGTGLAHVAFKIGDSLDEFRRVEAVLDAAGIATLYVADRAFTKSLHVEDPDGHEVELYIDTSDAWTRRTSSQYPPRHDAPASPTW